MRLLLLRVPDCPNAAVLESRLVPILASRPDIQVTREVVTTDDQARRLGMAGSPTLLLDGRDLFARPGQQPSLSCRLYPGDDGRPGPAPSGQQLLTALSTAYGGAMASVKQFQVTFDCAEPERVARFWCEVLGYVVPPPPEGFASWEDFDRALPPERQGSAFACVDPTGVGPRLFFQRVPEGKVAKNRLHLDVRVGTGLVGDERLAVLEAECARLIALGAARVRLLRADGFNESCLVMQDVEGNEFCLD